MTRVSVSKRVLRWAVARSGLPPSVLRGKFPKIPQWESGESFPTLRQLEDFAKATATPFGYMFLTEPPEDRLPIPYFRTLSEKRVHRPSPEILGTVHLMERRQAWMREFLIEEGQGALPFVKSVGLADQPHQVADRMRRELRLSSGWAATHDRWTDALQALILSAEESGILVVVNGVVGNNTHRRLDPGEFRGFVLVDAHAPLVFINGADFKAAQMFTLAHELAHLWFGSSAAFDLRGLQAAPDPTEQACDKVAAEFLVPEVELRQFWRAALQQDEPYQATARRFKVSEIVAARRALDLGLIGKTEFLRFYQAYQADERRRASKRPSGGDFYATQNSRISRRFAHVVLRAAREGKLLYREAYQLTGLYGKTFEQYADSLLPGGTR